MAKAKNGTRRQLLRKRRQRMDRRRERKRRASPNPWANISTVVISADDGASRLVTEGYRTRPGDIFIHDWPTVHRDSAVLTRTYEAMSDEELSEELERFFEQWGRETKVSVKFDALLEFEAEPEVRQVISNHLDVLLGFGLPMHAASIEIFRGTFAQIHLSRLADLYWRVASAEQDASIGAVRHALAEALACTGNELRFIQQFELRHGGDETEPRAGAV